MYYLAISIIVLGWLLLPYMTKILAKNINVFDFFIYTQKFMIITTLITITVLHILGYNVSNNVSDLSTKEILLFILRTVFFVLISFSLMWLLKNYQSTQVLVQIRPIVIVLSILIGINVFGEKVTNYEMFSMSLIILGVFLLNLSNGK